MIRVILFLLLVCGLALGATWLADRPGTVLLTWQGWRIETSVMVALVALVLTVVALMMLWSLVGWILRGPESFSLFLRGRRRARGVRAVGRGLVAVGVGDSRLAAREAAEARRYLGADPLALLLQAQSAQLSGDRGRAESAFRALLEEPQTRALGLRGLFVEAERRGDHVTARKLAEEAARSGSEPNWALEALFGYQCGERDWTGAIATLERMRANRSLERAVAERRRAVLLTAEAIDLAETDPERARGLALEANKLAPDLVPAAALAGRLVAEAGDPKRAARIVESTWRRVPHPDLAEIYLRARASDTARERLKRAEALAARVGGNPEGALVVAQAAVDAREFSRARQALEPLTSGAPTVRTCLLMEEIEELEHSDAGRAREWLSRALRAAPDPTWVADGVVSDTWMPMSPVTGRLDAFEWKVPSEAVHPALAPMAAIAATERLIAHAIPAEPAPQPLPSPPAAPVVPEPEPVDEPKPAVVEATVTEEVPALSPELPAPVAEPAAVAEPEVPAAPEPRPPVLPLPRPPDDPGPGDDDFEDARRIRLANPR